MSTMLNLFRWAFLLIPVILAVACVPTVAPEPAAVPPQTDAPSGRPSLETDLATVMPASSTPDVYPPLPTPTYTLPPYPWPTLTPWPTDLPEPTEMPTETLEPLPTLPPTPVVTLVPTVAPPFIPFPEGTTAQPFTLYYRDGEVIRSLRTEVDAEPQVLLDPFAEFSLHLPPEEAYIWTWGTFSPDGRSVALVLTGVPEPVDYSMMAHPVSIYILDLKSRVLRHLVDNGFDPVWSPDSKRLAYSSGDLWVADVETGKPSRYIRPSLSTILMLLQATMSGRPTIIIWC